MCVIGKSSDIKIYLDIIIRSSPYYGRNNNCFYTPISKGDSVGDDKPMYSKVTSTVYSPLIMNKV